MRGINRILAAASVFVVAASIGAVASVGGFEGETTEKTTGRGMKAVAKENRYALIIGVDYFPNLPTKEANESVASDAAERPSDEYDLNCCVLDARRLADALVEHAGFAMENVEVMTFQKGDELDPNDPTVPTAENIRRKIDALAGTLAADDMLLVAFSGHGVMLGVESNDDPEKRSYLCACDADLNRLSTFVDRKALLETLKQCRAERKLFIADCCRNFFELNEGARARGRAFGSRSTGAANPFETGNYGFAQISACREGQKALETEGVGGLFTSALIDGLRRGANASGELSLTAWFEYAKAQTTKRSQAILASNPNLGAVDKKTGERQKEQEPTLYLLGETPGWIFADGLPVDGLPGERWAKADALFDEAVKIRGRLRAGTIRSTGDGAESARVAEWRSAQTKIAEALELTAEAGESSVRRAKYVAEETRLTKWAATEAKRLAEAALEAFKKGEGGDEASVQTAITLMEEALALNDEPGNGYLLTTFKAKHEELQKEPKWTDAPLAGTRKTLEIAGVEYAFRYCPAGTFTMGGLDSKESFGRETPQWRVTLTNGFWALETEVTQAMWTSIMGKNPSWFSGTGGGAKDVGEVDTSDFPAEDVSWENCQEFLAKLNAYAPSGFVFRLPTEAEWEYCCRAGTRGDFAGTSLDDLGWYNGNSGKHSHKVRTKLPNPWGLYDTHGNVYEWCADWLGDYPAKETQNPVGSTLEKVRAMRGGSWFDIAESCRSMDFMAMGAGYRSFNLGMRFVIDRRDSQTMQALSKLTQETGANVEEDSDAQATNAKATRPLRRKAFLVGADDYADAIDIRWCKNDVLALRDRLLQIGFNPKDMTTLQNGEEFENFPTKRNIERRFKAFVESLEPGDLAFVYFCGHGFETESRDRFFAPIDLDLENLGETAISLDALTSALEESQADLIVLALDACRDTKGGGTSTRSLFDACRGFGGASSYPSRGGLLGTVALAALRTPIKTQKVICVLSCEAGELSYEGGEGKAKDVKHGFFTLSLLEALDPSEPKADVNRDGVATFSEVFAYAARRTDELAQMYYSVSQRPVCCGETVDFIFVDFKALSSDGNTNSRLRGVSNKR